MAKQDLANVVGRALMDTKFAAELHHDPVKASKSIGANLTHEELQSVKDVSAAHMKSVSDTLRSKMNAAAFFDQTQHQQQARMD